MFSGLSPAQPSTRRWTAVASFTLQFVLITAALVFPMLYPQNLPQVFLARRIFVPLSNGEVQAEPSNRGHSSGGAIVLHPIVVRNDSRSIPGLDQTSPADNRPPGIEAMAEVGDPRSTISTLVTGPSNPILPSVRPAKPPRTSVMMEGNLIHRVEPQYPVIAKQIHLEGSVILKAIISREGNIERLEVASGPGVLALAAKEAVGQWKYRPYLLNGEPIEVETEITVNFVLAH